MPYKKLLQNLQCSNTYDSSVHCEMNSDVINSSTAPQATAVKGSDRLHLQW